MDGRFSNGGDNDLHAPFISQASLMDCLFNMAKPDEHATNKQSLQRELCNGARVNKLRTGEKLNRLEIELNRITA